MKYKIKITDGIGIFTGDFYADTEEQAEQEAKEYYAMELDTDQESILIIK